MFSGKGSKSEIRINASTFEDYNDAVSAIQKPQDDISTLRSTVTNIAHTARGQEPQVKVLANQKLVEKIYLWFQKVFLSYQTYVSILSVSN